MSPDSIAGSVVREVPLLREDQPLGECVAALLDHELPALPVTDKDGLLVGIFGEREFIGAIFPGYLGELKYAGFVKRATDEVLEKRAGCLVEAVSKYVNREHIDVGPEHSDAQLAEIFLHHRVLIVPVADAGRVTGMITRADFFRGLAQRLPAGA